MVYLEDNALCKKKIKFHTPVQTKGWLPVNIWAKIDDFGFCICIQTEANVCILLNYDKL